MKHFPLALRLVLFGMTCVYIAKCLHVTLGSTLLHLLCYFAFALAYLGWSWVHLALEKLWYDRRHLHRS